MSDVSTLLIELCIVCLVWNILVCIVHVFSIQAKNVLKTALIVLAMVGYYVVRYGMRDKFFAIFYELGRKEAALLLSFLFGCVMVRMLIEQFLLHIQQPRGRWILLIGIFLLQGVTWLSLL